MDIIDFILIIMLLHCIEIKIEQKQIDEIKDHKCNVGTK